MRLPGVETLSLRSWPAESESAPEATLRNVAIIKAWRGGTAFWKSLMTILRDDVEEVKVTALQLHSRAWLYIVPLSALSDVSVWGNLGIIVADKIDITHYCRKFKGKHLKGHFKCKEIVVRRGKVKVREWWGEAEYEYLEINDEGKKYKVFRGRKPAAAESESVG